MEVMSSLLLCALVALVPQGLGEETVKTNYLGGKFNRSLWIQQNSYPPHQLLLNLNEQVSIRTTLQKNVNNDHSCKKCLKCMDQALKAYSSRHRGNSQEVNYELLNNKISHRIKRDVNNTTDVTLSKEKKPKSKKNKVHKTVTVTKYNIDGVVTALKVKENSAATLIDNTTAKPSVATCEVYSVKKSFPCDSAEADLMIKLTKRKTGKKNKREREENTEITTEQTRDIHSSMYRKREVDNSQMPENVMSSVEDFY